MKGEVKTGYPLTWPPGRPRSAKHERSTFRADSFWVNFRELVTELRRLGARNAVISCNVALKADGSGELARQVKITDPGVAVYFEYEGRDACFACDRWHAVSENVRAITLTIEALRGIGRWGTGDMVSAAFTGFTALPAHAPPPPWYTILGVDPKCTIDEAEAAYQRLAEQQHPDRGGTNEAMAELNRAIERARKELQR